MSSPYVARTLNEYKNAFAYRIDINSGRTLDTKHSTDDLLPQCVPFQLWTQLPCLIRSKLSENSSMRALANLSAEFETLR